MLVFFIVFALIFYTSWQIGYILQPANNFILQTSAGIVIYLCFFLMIYLINKIFK